MVVMMLYLLGRNKICCKNVLVIMFLMMIFLLFLGFFKEYYGFLLMI